jgi:hypothetical protein
LSVTCDSPGPLVSSSNKVDHHDITEILLKVALNIIKQTNKTNLFGDLLNIVHTKSCFQIIHGKGYSRNAPEEGYSRDVPEEGYSRNVPEEGYSRNALCSLNLISTFLYTC